MHAVKRERNGREVARTLSALEGATKDGKNVMPFLVDCCKAYATVGEMTRVFREIFGEFKGTVDPLMRRADKDRP